MKQIEPIIEDILSREGPMTAYAIAPKLKKKYSTKFISQNLKRMRSIEIKGKVRVKYQNSGPKEVIVWGVKESD